MPHYPARILHPPMSGLIPFGFERLVSAIRELRECRQVLEPLIVRDMRGVQPEQLGAFADTHRSHLRLLT
jgi:hypothetical protein